MAVLLIAPTMPPMQNPDEGAHAYRADQISHLGLIARRMPDGEIGGRVDAGLLTEWNRVAGIRFDPAAKISPAMYAPLAWGKPVPAGFPNTAIYPPFLYLPAALIAAAARGLGIELPGALIPMRLVSGLVSVALTTAAIASAGNVAIWLFAIALLPMSLALDAAISQDGPMLACIALAVALHLRLRRSDMRRPRLSFAGLCLLLTLVGMARPPYAAFAILGLAAPVRPTDRLAGVAFILACVAGWSLLNLSHVVIPPLADPRLQLARLLAHPLRLPLLFLTTWLVLADYLTTSFIGLLGWLDVTLPLAYHRAAWLVMAAAAAACPCAGRGPLSARAAAASAIAALGAIAGVGVIQYLSWTKVGAPIIDGLQGRYFLGPAMVLGGVLARSRPSEGRLAAWLAAPVIFFPFVTLAVILHALLMRYFV